MNITQIGGKAMKHLSLTCIIFVLLFICVLSAQIPRTISYQGILTDMQGTAVPDGSYNLTFKLYDAAAGGSALWTETQTLTVTAGVFNATLGSETALDLAFDRGYWLGIAVNSGSELTPRIEMTASAYSLRTAAVSDSCITSRNISNSQVVRSINGLKDHVDLNAGNNISITPVGNTLIVAANLTGIGNTLDQAYDQGGPGAGRTIFADSGAFEVTGSDGVLFSGTFGDGRMPVEGAGTRMMWYPRKAAFRAGRTEGTSWDDVNIGISSIAMGSETTASGPNSTALGYLTKAGGSASTAMGSQTTAGASYSTAMGLGATASEQSSTSIGESTLASGYASVAIGLHSISSGPYSIAIGGYTTASDYYALALGCSTSASGNNSTAMGLQTTASGSHSTALGYQTTASNTASTSLGFQTTASGGNSVALGYQTTASGAQSMATGFSSIAKGHNSFAIGFRANANHNGSMVIAANSSPDIADSVISGGHEQIVLRADGGMYITNTGGQAPYEPDRLINTSTGAYLTAGGVWTDNCDRHAKENFEPVNSAELLGKLKSLEITVWNYKTENPDIRHIGPVAQDFYAAFGVGNDDKSISTIDPAGIALATIQELEKRTGQLREENEHLKERIILLEHNMKRLEELFRRENSDDLH